MLACTSILRRRHTTHNGRVAAASVVRLASTTKTNQRPRPPLFPSLPKARLTTPLTHHYPLPFLSSCSSAFRCRLEAASDQNLIDVLGNAGDLLLVVDCDGFKVISQAVLSDPNQTTVATCAWDFASVEEWEVVPEPTGGESHSFRLLVADPVPIQVQFCTHADIPAQKVEDDIETLVYEISQATLRDQQYEQQMAAQQGAGRPAPPPRDAAWGYAHAEAKDESHPASIEGHPHVNYYPANPDNIFTQGAVQGQQNLALAIDSTQFLIIGIPRCTCVCVCGWVWVWVWVWVCRRGL